VNSSVGHLELALLRISLHSLERRFLRTVGRCYVELDEARAQSAKLRARFYPAAHRNPSPPASRRGCPRKPARMRPPAQTPTRSASNKLHHQLARNYHPDLATDPAHAALCEQLMTEVNLAHSDSDLVRLEILHGALTRPVTLSASSKQLTRTPLAELRERVVYATRQRHDLLARTFPTGFRKLTMDEKLRTAQSSRPSGTVAPH